MPGIRFRGGSLMANRSGHLALGALLACLVAFQACTPSAAPSAPSRASPGVGTSGLPAGVAPSDLPPDLAGQVLFDDFNYTNLKGLERHGWIARARAGWPGVRDARWSKAGISFIDDPARPGNRLVRLTASTDGTPRGTVQAQLCHQRKFLEGVYATRIRFYDDPTRGPDGDGLVESFYTISPLKDLDPAFSELDFEYLPNGGWGRSSSVLWANSWETARIEPWFQDNEATAVDGGMSGWHTLVIQVTGGINRFYVDGDLVAEHGGEYYPESPMSINYNLWFIADAILSSTGKRSYVDEVDWVYHQAGVSLLSAEIEEQVDRFRAARQTFTDSVPAWSPPQASPCDL
jgi:hypothetical protein